MREAKLDNVKVIVPFKDSGAADRKRNLEYVIEYYLSFGYGISIEEQAPEEEFCKARIINKALDKYHMYKYLAILDGDILLHPIAIKALVDQMEEESALYGYPFSGEFLSVPYHHVVNADKKKVFEMLNQTKWVYPSMSKLSDSVGGCIVVNRVEYAKIREIELAMSWGPDDTMRDTVLRKLGHEAVRCEIPLFHIKHNVSLGNKGTQDGLLLLQSMNMMTKEQMEAYVASGYKWIQGGSMFTKVNINDKKYVGGLGNQLLQIAAIADKNYCIPENWHYREYFPSLNYKDVLPNHILQEETWFKRQGLPLDENNVYTIQGYFQSARYWKDAIFPLIGKFVPPASDKIPEDIEEATVIHYRGGDFLKDPDTFLDIPAGWYKHQLETYIKDAKIVYLVTNDPKSRTACKLHREIPNLKMIEGTTEMEDFTIIHKAKNCIMGGSTFALTARLIKDAGVTVYPGPWMTKKFDCRELFEFTSNGKFIGGFFQV